MAHTAEMRDQMPLCGARKKNGERCRAIAGTGTQHPGIGACKFHGGSTPNGNKAALKRELTQRMATLGEPIEKTTALDALLQELWASTGHVAWLRQQLADMSKDELGTAYGQAVTGMYAAERDRKTRIARMAIESGVDEAAIRVAEAQLTLLGTALSKAADTAGLSEPMRRRLGAALRDELGALEAEPKSLQQINGR
jgi:hypothetical protein